MRLNFSSFGQGRVNGRQSAVGEGLKTTMKERGVARAGERGKPLVCLLFT